MNTDKRRGLLKTWVLFLFFVIGFIVISPATIRVEFIFILSLLVFITVLIPRERLILVGPIIGFSGLYLISLFLPESYFTFILSFSGMIFAGIFALILADWFQSSG